MDFAFSPEQEMLRGAARDYLADRYPIERVIELVDSEAGWDPAAWKELADLGWLDPDLGVLEHAVLFEASGAALLPAPFFTTVGVAGAALSDDLGAAVAGGERSVTLAVAEAGGPMTLADLAATAPATTASAGGRLTGTKVLVPDAGVATDALVVAAGPDGVGIYAVELTPAIVTVRATIDRTRRLGDLTLDGTPARIVATGDAARQALHAVRLRALAAAAAEAVGVGQRALELAADHAKGREQFGRIIGTYQAVSHRIADMFASVELARSLAYWASWAVAEGDEQAADAVAAAAAKAGTAAVLACEGAIQVHGGVGFTWEHPLQRYYKRAQWLEAYEGGARAHRRQLASAVVG